MEEQSSDYSNQCRFDAFCKRVLRNEASNYARDMKRRREHEVSMSALSQTEWNELTVSDHYPSNSTTFTVCGYVIHINDASLADALSQLPENKRDILLLYFGLNMSDREVGELVGMSRSAVQRHRMQALSALREALPLVMQNGGKL